MAEADQTIQSCILFATADWDEPYWTNKQHCAKTLAELGIRVLYVESVGLRSPKAASARDWGRLWNRLRKGVASLLLGARERSPGVFVLSPLMIPAGHRHLATRLINRWLLKAAIARSVAGEPFKRPLIWTYHPFMLDAIDGIEGQAILYHCVDDLTAIPGVDTKAFRSAERKLLERTDVVFATAPALTEYCKQYKDNTYYLPNVVDVDHFSKALNPGPIPADLAKIPEPRLCYHGVLSDFKVDFQLLLDCAKRNPQWSWVFIGEEREGQKSATLDELATLANVYFLGYRSYKQLPDYLRGMQVGLLPSLINNYTRSMFPMKFYEYLAAGLPVISTPLDFTRDELPRLKIAVGCNAFGKAIEDQLRGGKIERTDVLNELIGKTWKARTLEMLKKVVDEKNLIERETH